MIAIGFRDCAWACGAVAQLGERLVRNEEVSGSIPLSSTKESITYIENLGQISSGYSPWVSYGSLSRILNQN